MTVLLPSALLLSTALLLSAESAVLDLGKPVRETSYMPPGRDGQAAAAFDTLLDGDVPARRRAGRASIGGGRRPPPIASSSGVGASIANPSCVRRSSSLPANSARGARCRGLY